MKQIAICVAFFLIGATTVLSQLPTGTILGTVKDPSGAVVPGATVTARDTDTGVTRTATTDSNGTYRCNALAVGNYQVSVQQAGFKATVNNGITLTVGQEAVIDITLEVGSVEQQVEVTTQAPAIDTTNGALGGLVNEQQVADLPLNGRNYIQLALLQSGITQDYGRNNSSTSLAASGTWFSSSGAPPRSNGYLLDGTSLSTYGGGSGASITNNTLGLDGIQEFRVITNSFDAEYGMVMGSQMVMVSKSGTNKFHGDGFEYLRNSAMDARNYFDTAASSGLTLAGAQRRLPPFRRNNFGGSVGGPILKNKTFFMASYEGLRQKQGLSFTGQTIPNGCAGPANATITSAQCPSIPVNVIVPGNPGCTNNSSNPSNPASGTAPTLGSCVVSSLVAPWISLYPGPNQANAGFSWSFNQPVVEDYGQVRVDHTFSAADNMFVRYTTDSATVSNGGTLPGYPFSSTSRSHYLTVAENHIFSPALLNTGRFSWSRTKQSISPVTFLSGPSFSFQPGSPIGGITVGGLSVAPGSGTGPSAANQTVYSYSDDLFYTKGRSSFKFGTLINQYQTFVQNGVGLNGSISFADFPHFLAASAKNWQAISPGGIAFRTVHYNTLGWYAQDDYRATSRLTLNLGLRYEFNTNINAVGTGANVNGALENPVLDVNFTPTTLLTKNPSYHNFSPRLGLAWDVFGDGKTSVRAGFAELYQIAGWVSFLHGATRSQPGQNQVTVNNPGANWTLPFTFPTGQAALSSRSPAPYDWNIKQPKMLQYNVSVQHQFPWQLAVTVAYSGSRGYNLETLTDGNPVKPTGVPSGGLCVANTPPGSQPIPINQQNLIDGQANTCGLSSDVRQNPNWGPMNFIADARDSWYNALQISVQKHITKGLQFQSNFTWSKLLDDTQGSSSAAADLVGSAAYVSDPWNPLVDKGPATFDQPYAWQTNVLYHLPTIASNRFVSGAVNGWWVSAILQIQGGIPFTPLLSTSRTNLLVDGTKAVDRPDLLPGRNNHNITSGTSPGCLGVPAGTPLGTPTLWYDPCAFSIQPSGFLGTLGRDSLLGPNFRNVDFSVVKDTKVGFLGEAGSVEFRAEVFNILNRPNFGLPGISLFSGSGPAAGGVPQAPLTGAGALSANPTAGPSRQVQLALKILF